MVTELFSVLGEVVTGALTVMVSAFAGVVDIFYDTTTSKFTIYGILLLVAMGLGFIYFAFYVIRSFLRM